MIDKDAPTRFFLDNEVIAWLQKGLAIKYTTFKSPNTATSIYKDGVAYNYLRYPGKEVEILIDGKSIMRHNILPHYEDAEAEIERVKQITEVLYLPIFNRLQEQMRMLVDKNTELQGRVTHLEAMHANGN